MKHPPHFSDYDTAVEIDEDRWLRMKTKTIWIVVSTAVAVTALAVVSWTSVKGDIADTQKTQIQMGARQDSMDRRLTEQAEFLIRMDAKLDYLTGARPSRPAAGLRPSRPLPDPVDDPRD